MLSFVPAICPSCAEFLVSPANTVPHEHLTAKYRQTSREGHSDGQYACLECESVWMLSFSGNILDSAKLVDHKMLRSADDATTRSRPCRCNGNQARCTLLNDASLQ